MAKIKITVLRRMSNPDFAEKYCVPEAELPCLYFEDGQEFIIESARQPEGFCGWAWNDLFRTIMILGQGGDYEGWSKDKDSLIRCCTDGIRPVVFEVRKIED